MPHLRQIEAERNPLRASSGIRRPRRRIRWGWVAAVVVALLVVGAIVGASQSHPTTTRASHSGDPSAAIGTAFDAAFAVFGVFVLLGLAAAVFTLVTLIEVVRVPDSAWQRADQSKIGAVLLVLFLGPLGALVYRIAMRPALRRAGVIR